MKTKFIELDGDRESEVDGLVPLSKGDVVALDTDEFYEVERVFFNVKELKMTYYVRLV